VGRDKTTIYGLTAEGVVAALDARGVLQNAETSGLQRRVIIMLAQRLKPDEGLNFEQALVELERGCEGCSRRDRPRRAGHQ